MLEPRLSVTTPRLEIYHYAFSTNFHTYTSDEIRHIDIGLRHCAHLTTGGLYTKDGRQIQLADRHGGSHWDMVSSIDRPQLLNCEIPEQIGVLPGRTLYLGHYMNHYGHFITETMSRLWALDADIRYDRFVFFPFIFDDGNIIIHKFQNYFLRRFGLQGQSILSLRHPIAFEELHVPQALSQINKSANLNLKKTYDFIAKPLRTGLPVRRIFLSRLQPYARVTNVTEIETLFRNLNFEILYPETMDITEQLSGYANAAVLAGFAGSALHNCVFCRPGTQLIELGDVRSPSEPLIMQQILNQLARVDARYLPYAGSQQGEMDIEKLAAAIAIILSTEEITAPLTLLWPGELIAHLAGLGDIRVTGNLQAGRLEAPVNEIEGLAINIDHAAPFGCEYAILTAGNGWTPWLAAGQFAGSRGAQTSLHGFALRLTGAESYRYECLYHGGFIGNTALVTSRNGAPCIAPNHAPLISLQIELRHR